MTWYIGGESDWYEPREPMPCPCSEAGLLLCWCGGDVSVSDARDWLEGQGVPAETLHAAEAIHEVDSRFPGGWEAFYDETAGRKAFERLRRQVAAEAMRRAA